MSDLISRSKLINDIATYFFSDKFNLDRLGRDLREIIDNQPIAYDVDKVVEELKSLQTYNMGFVTLMSDLQRNGVYRHYVCLEDAIEIVKQGGVIDG